MASKLLQPLALGRALARGLSSQGFAAPVASQQAQDAVPVSQAVPSALPTLRTPTGFGMNASSVSALPVAGRTLSDSARITALEQAMKAMEIMRTSFGTMRLITFVSLVGNRVVSRKVVAVSDIAEGKGMQNAVVKPSVRENVIAFLEAARPDMPMTVTEFASNMDGNYMKSNEARHANDDMTLDKLAAEIYALDVVASLVHTMKFECTVLKHYKYLLNRN